jgi:transcriptional regulator with XRE-family HTH domain
MPTINQWTGNHLRIFQRAAGLTNERLAERLNVSVRTVAYWRTKTSGVLPDLAQRVLPQALEVAPEPVRQRFDSHVGSSANPAKAAENVIAAAAEEADTDPVYLAAELDPESIEWLWEQSLEIATVTNRPAFDTFTAARRVRRRALDLAERTRRPATLSDLYAIAGQATALMASSAFDLSRWDASESLSKCAISYASLAGHASLQSWTLGLAALLANWRNEPDTALRLFRRGLRVAPAGTPQMRLRFIASRSYALLGDTASVREVLEQARHDQDDADRHDDALSRETGGEFAFGRARAAACAAAAWLDLGYGQEAGESAQLALNELTALPTGRQPFSQINGARIDIASARLLGHDLAGATEALRQVLDLPPSLRNMSLSGRLVRAGKALASPRWSGDAQARQLTEAIRSWLHEDSVTTAPGDDD